MVNKLPYCFQVHQLVLALKSALFMGLLDNTLDAC